MADDNCRDLERDFLRRNETLRSLYDSETFEMTADELSSLTPILNSLKDDSFRYREIEKIAEGGEKKITLVHDARLDRRIAMARAVRNDSVQDLEQFLREARLTANLAHPNIMPVYNMGLDETGEPFFSMELVPGDSLKQIVRKLRDADEAYRRDYPVQTLLNIFTKICDAVAYAHSRNVLHLDIKPDNIRVGEFGEVFVCDWGLGRVVNSEEEDACDSDVLDGDVLNDMTLSGIVKGTPGFMAPEQTEKDGVKTQQTDVYALGALLYVLLTYELPVDGASANDVVKNTREGRVVPVRRRKSDVRVPKGLAAVIMKALSLKPKTRYSSVIEMRRDIARYMSGHPTLAEHAGVITRISLLLQRHSRLAFLLIFFLILLAFVVSGNLAAVSREKAEAVMARRRAEENFELYKQEQRLTQSLGEELGEAVSFTVRSRDFVNAPSMIRLLETGLSSESIDVEKKLNLYEQKGILHFVLQEFNAANESFNAAGKTKRIGQLRALSKKYAEIKLVDKKRLTDDQLADLFNEAKTASQMSLYYLYYHHMRRRPASANPEDYVRLAGAVLDKLNYSKYAQSWPLKFEKRSDGYHLNLSGAPYTVYTLNIIGVYRRQVLGPLKLTSLDLSNTDSEHFREFGGIKLDELRMSGVPIGNKSKSYFVKHLNRFQLKRVILDVDYFPEDTIAELRKKMDVIDAKKFDKARKKKVGKKSKK